MAFPAQGLEVGQVVVTILALDSSPSTVDVVYSQFGGRWASDATIAIPFQGGFTVASKMFLLAFLLQLVWSKHFAVPL